MNKWLNSILTFTLIIALAAGMALQHHHHDADGTVCIELHESHTDKSSCCHQDSENGNTPHEDPCDCAMHIDDCRIDDNSTHATPTVDVMDIPAPTEIEECATATRLYRHYKPTKPIRSGLLTSALRAPPCGIC